MSEPRTLQPLQFFKDAGAARGNKMVQDFRPTVVKGDPLDDYPTVEDTAHPVSVTTTDELNEPARPPMDADDAPEPDETIPEPEDLPPGVVEGIAQAERGELVDRGSFAQYATEDDDDDQGGFEDLLTRTEDQESIAADGTQDGG